MPVPVWKVEIGWGSQIAGVLVFGFSEFKTPTTFTVTNKALTSNVATITAPGHSVVAGDTISVTGIDVTFNTTGVVVSSVTATTILYPKTATNVTSIASTGAVGVVRTSDTFANAFVNFFTGDDDDVTADVQKITIRRGRDDILSQMNAGTCDLELQRPNDRPYWNPANPTSALNVDNAPGFVPMRPVRITATYSSTTYGLFWGFLRSAKFDFETGICRLSCVDLFVFLQRTALLDPALSTTQGASTALEDAYTPDIGAASNITSSVATTQSRSGFVRTVA